MCPGCGTLTSFSQHSQHSQHSQLESPDRAAKQSTPNHSARQPQFCSACLGRLRRAPLRQIADLQVRSAFVHDAMAARLVRRLKYRGHLAMAEFFAAHMVELVPSHARALVPVPRAWTRRLQFGIDPGLELARGLRSRTGLPVVSALVPPIYGRPRAGVARDDRAPARLAAHQSAMRLRHVRGAVLIDDVVTTGTTLLEGADLLGNGSILAGLTATSAL